MSDHHCVKRTRHGVFSGLYFPVFGLNTEIYEVNLRIQSEYGKIPTRKNSVLGHFSHCAQKCNESSYLPSPRYFKLILEVVLQRYSYKKVFWKFAANFQEHTHAEVWFHTSAWGSLVNLLHIFRTPFPKNTSGGLLLYSMARFLPLFNDEHFCAEWIKVNY